MNIWTTLNIPYTTDRNEIKKAYAQQSKRCHPEEDPEGFQALKDAYKMAIRIAENAALFEAAELAQQNEAQQRGAEPEKDAEIAEPSEKNAEMTLALESHTEKPFVPKKEESSEGSLDFSALDQKISEIAQTRTRLEIIIAGELKNAHKYKLTPSQYEEFLITTGGDIGIRRKKRAKLIFSAVTEWMIAHWLVSIIIIFHLFCGILGLLSS